MASVMKKKRELKCFRKALATNKCGNENERYHCDSKTNQVIPDFYDDLLDMTLGLDVLNQLRGPAEITVHTGGNNQRIHFALSDNRARICNIGKMLLYRQ